MLQASSLADVLAASLGRAPLTVSLSPINVMFAPYGCTKTANSDPLPGSLAAESPQANPSAGVTLNSTASSNSTGGGANAWGCWELLDWRLFWVDASTVTSLVTAPGEFAVVAAIHGMRVHRCCAFCKHLKS